MKKLKPLIASTYVALALAAMPFAAFAQGNDQHGEQERDAHRPSFFEQLKSNLSGWHLGFGGKIALANTVASATPVIKGITSPTVLSVDQTGTWQVNAYDPQNKSLSYAVDWGDGPQMMARMATSEPVFSQTASFDHAYGAAGNYTVKFTVKNDLGLQTSSSVTVHVASSTKPAPVISALNATSTKTDQAKVSWKTDVRADSELWYGTSTPLDTSVEADIIRKAQVFDHSLTLRKLSPNTTYYVVVGSKNKDGIMTVSSQTSFTTPAPANQNQPPAISSVTGPEKLAAGTEGTWAVNASDPENKSLSYAVDWGDGPQMMARMATSEPVFTQTATFDHVYADAGVYTVNFTVKDDAGLTATSSRVVTVTPAAPTVISGLTASSTVSDEASLSWKTDNAADSSVWFGTSTPVDITGEAAITDGTYVTDHNLILNGLTASTTYYAVVGSKDGNNNVSTSSVSFTTAGE